MSKNNFFSNLNFSKIFSFVIFILSLFILLFTLYRKYFFYMGVEIAYANAYYFIIFLGFIFSIIVFKLPDSISKKLFIIFFSTVITIYIIEYSINYINFKDSYRISLAKKQSVNYDKRTIIEVVKDLKKKNKKVNIAFPTVGYVPPNGIKIKDKFVYPLAGISNSKTVVCNESGTWSTYFSDRYGFNNPDYLWEKKEINVLLIGDSYVHGDCVDPKNNIAGQLRLNSDSDVLNLGYRGNSPFLQFATFIEYGLQKKPKNIFWFFSEENDLHEIDRDKNKKILTSYIKNNYSQNLKNIQKDIDGGLEKLHKKIIFYKNLKLQNLRLSFLNKLISKAKKAKKEKVTNKYKVGDNRDNLEIYANIIKEVDKISKKNNFKLNLVYLPSHARYVAIDDSGLVKVKVIEMMNDIKIICNDLNINFINIHEEVFLKANNPLDLFPLQINSHYTEIAYRDISKILLDYID